MQRTQTAHALPASAAQLSLLLVLLIVDSLHFVFARALHDLLDPTAAATYVLGLATLQVGIYALWRRRLTLAAFRRHWLFFTVVGFLVGGSTMLSYLSVGYIDPGTAAMLGKTSTLWALIFGLVWLHEQLTPRQLGGAALAIAGAFVITFQPGDLLRWGSWLVLVSTFMYALHMALVKRYGGDMEFLNFFFYRLLTTTLWLALLAETQAGLPWPAPKVWLLLLVTATVDVTISRTLYYLALRRLPMSVLSIILTVSPVVAVAWSLLLFGTFPTPQQLVGGIAVLAGALLATLRPSGGRR